MHKNHFFAKNKSINKKGDKYEKTFYKESSKRLLKGFKTILPKNKRL